MKMNLCSLFFVLFLILSIDSRAQSDSTLKKQTVHGIVKNEKNKPVQNASVVVEGEENGTVTDSLGVFKIDAKPNSVLIINAQGYQSAMEPVAGKELITAFLVKESSGTNGFSQGTKESQSIQNDFQNYANTESSRNYSGSFLPVFSNKENTVGSRYLFDKWVPGKAFNEQGVLINKDSFLFNYDKIAKKFLATQDRQKVIEINADAIKSIAVTNEDTLTVFEKMPLIDPKNFFIELVKSKEKYSLYKSISTTFHRADYTTNGIFESGNNFDSFIDKFDYYIVFPGGKTFKKIELKRKFLKEVLANDEKKVKQYFSKDEEGVINESFLKGLITFLNQ